MSFEEVAALLRAAGLRMTAQRRAIVAQVMAAHGHINPADLVRAVRSRVPQIDPSTVYRTLTVLDDIGVLRHTHSETGIEYHHAAEAGHAHLTCHSCGAVLTLSPQDLRHLAEDLEARTGFEPDLTHFAISGLCSRCKQR